MVTIDTALADSSAAGAVVADVQFAEEKNRPRRRCRPTSPGKTSSLSNDNGGGQFGTWLQSVQEGGLAVFVVKILAETLLKFAVPKILAGPLGT